MEEASSGDRIQELELQLERLLRANRQLQQEAASLRRQLSSQTDWAVDPSLMEHFSQTEAAFTQAPQAVLIAAPDARILRGNPAAEALFGCVIPYHEPWESHTALHLYCPDGDPADPRDNPLTRAALDGETVLNQEMLVMRPEEQSIPLLVSAAPVLLPSGAPSLAVCIFQNIAELKQVEVSLADRVKKLERSNKDLEEFAFVASHDLQSPLRKISSFARHLLEHAAGSLDEEQFTYLERIQHSADHMTSMLSDLLTFSRIGTRTQPFRQVDLAKVAADVLNDLEYELEHSQGKVEIGALPVVRGDPTQMHQLLLNLIGNALKFHRPGVPPLVMVSSSSVYVPHAFIPRQVEIRVEDNGIGFDPQAATRLFQPFQRLVGRSEYAGSGIGLAICRKIVERHGGIITARGKPGEGAVFIVQLPLIS
jgi:signal transduction histidine kinase